MPIPTSAPTTSKIRQGLAAWRRVPVGAGLLALCLLSGCSPVKLINAVTPDDTFALTRDVSFGPLPANQVDVYRPLGTPPAGGWPVVVFIHGGSWQKGSREQYKFLGEALASRGIVLMSSSYRLYPEVSYPDFLPDSAKAVAYALAHAGRYGGNPRRVLVMGHSAGAYNAAMVALDDRWLAQQGHHITELAGWVGLAGPYDFIPLKDKSVQPVFHHPDVPPDSQPIAHASAQAPRTFLGVSNFDAQVNPDTNSGHLATRLESLGVPVIFKRYEGVDHLTLIGAFSRPLHRMAPVLDDVSAFISSLPEAPRKNGP
jgi:acetyl esterase/lipase